MYLLLLFKLLLVLNIAHLLLRQKYLFEKIWIDVLVLSKLLRIVCNKLLQLFQLLLLELLRLHFLFLILQTL
jgi:hypothetical protein